MPILDIQARFRELGRIRTGKTEPTARGKTRPVKLARFRLTSPWPHLIEQAATVFGGTPAPWRNEATGTDEAELLVEVDSLPVVIPPGEVMDQWYELWTGGGCARRCDGIRQTLVDRPCQCPADPADRQAEAAKGKACKPTTRLRLMIPDVADVGIWRLESHGFHAAAELGGAVGLIETATRSGAMIPADLRLAAREGARRPGEQRKKFFVPVLSFRGTLGPVLDRLGILEEGATMPRILGVETRPEISTGGAPALPAGRTAFDPAPVEEASFPPPALPHRAPDEPPAPAPAPPPPDPAAFTPPPARAEAPAPAPLPDPEAFDPPPAPPADEIEGERTFTGPQLVAMMFQDRGIRDRAHRLRMAAFVIGREIETGNDLTPREIPILLDLLSDDVGFADLLAEVPAETPQAPPTAPETPPAPAQAPTEVLTPEVVDGPPRRRKAPAPAPTTAHPAGMDADAWRAFLTSRGVKVTEVLREAARRAAASGVEAPGTLGEISDSGLADDLFGFVEETAAARGDR